MMRAVRSMVGAMLVAAAVFSARAVLAGPPLLCFPYDIGNARSLPMAQGSWRAIDPRYDVSRLVDDTLVLLAPETPVVVRMETLRRATIYAAEHPAIASALFTTVKQRADAKAPLAAFDYGYLVEAFREAEMVYKRPLVTDAALR